MYFIFYVASNFLRLGHMSGEKYDSTLYLNVAGYSLKYYRVVIYENDFETVVLTLFITMQLWMKLNIKMDFSNYA